MADLRNLIIAAGFVRVDGLQCLNGSVIPQQSGDTLRFEYGNGFMVIAAPEGKVWISATDDSTNSIFNELMFQLFTYAQKGGISIPLNNGEGVSYRDILRRVANPNWEPVPIEVGSH